MRFKIRIKWQGGLRPWVAQVSEYNDELGKWVFAGHLYAPYTFGWTAWGDFRAKRPEDAWERAKAAVDEVIRAEEKKQYRFELDSFEWEVEVP